MSIYVIAYRTFGEDYSGRPRVEREIDPDLGYFTDEASAQAAVDVLDVPALARHAEQMAEHKRALAAWRAKHEQARALGFANPDSYPWEPQAEPDRHVVIEIKPASAQFTQARPGTDEEQI